MMELAKCPKCGSIPIRVKSNGMRNFGNEVNHKYVTCHDVYCMPIGEFYSPAAWNNMAKREKALKARIAELEGKK